MPRCARGIPRYSLPSSHLRVTFRPAKSPTPCAPSFWADHRRRRPTLAKRKPRKKTALQTSQPHPWRVATRGNRALH
eukprot:7811857-Lingulodinium_polyedra.AAC.1